MKIENSSQRPLARLRDCPRLFQLPGKRDFPPSPGCQGRQDHYRERKIDPNPGNHRVSPLLLEDAEGFHRAGSNPICREGLLQPGHGPAASSGSKRKIGGYPSARLICPATGFPNYRSFQRCWAQWKIDFCQSSPVVQRVPPHFCFLTIPRWPLIPPWPLENRYPPLPFTTFPVFYNPLIFFCFFIKFLKILTIIFIVI